MLKIVNISLAITVASLGSPSAAQADVYDAMQNICTLVNIDDKGELRKKTKIVESDHSMQMQNNYTGVSCSQVSLFRSALNYSDIENGTLLVKKLPKSDLATGDKDGNGFYARTMEKNIAESSHVVALNDGI